MSADGGKRKALVTGGAGFLGQHLIQQLVDSGEYDVTCFDLREVKLEECTSIAGDLSSSEAVSAAIAGMDVVFHAATAAPTAQNAASAKSLMQKVNIVGTHNVIDACRKHNVSKLIYTSSASVVFSGSQLVDVDETHPYADPPMDYYTGTKMQAEKLILEANSDTLATCALRPSGIFGPGEDKLLVPSLVKRSKAGKMKYIIGSGSNLFDFTYVGNVASAHLDVERTLRPGSAASGEAYFITNREHYPFWTMMGDLTSGLGYERPHIHLPIWLMLIVAYISAFLGRFGVPTDLNPMRVRIASAQRTYMCKKAVTDFGYVPKVSLEEGIRLTLAGFQHLSKGSDSSKVD